MASKIPLLDSKLCLVLCHTDSEFDYVAFFGQWDNSKCASAETWKVFAYWDLSFAAGDPFCSHRKKTTSPMETHSSVDSSDYQHQPPELGQSTPIDIQLIVAMGVSLGKKSRIAQLSEAQMTNSLKLWANILLLF